MNKNKKIISLVCVLAMMFTMLSSFVVVKAAGEPGMTLTYVSTSDDGKTVTLKAGYENIPGGVTGTTVAINLPDTVKTATATKLVSTGAAEAGGDYTTEGSKYVSITIANISDATAETGELAQIVIEFNSPITKGVQLALADDSNIMSGAATPVAYYVGDEYSSFATKISNAQIDVPKFDDGSTKVADKTREDADNTADEPEEPDDTPEVVPVNAGMTLEYVKTTGNTVTLKAGYKNIPGGVTGTTVAINLPDSVKTATATKLVSTGAAEAGGDYTTEGSKYVSITIANISDATAETGELAQIEVEYNTLPEKDTDLSLADDSNIMSGAATPVAYYVGDEYSSFATKIPAANAVIPGSASTPAAEPKPPVVVNTLNGLDDTTVENATTDETVDPTTGDSDYYLSVTPKINGADAAYGEDGFKASIDGGQTTLTEKQYKNLINGHFGADNVKALGINSIADLTKKLSFIPYKDGFSVTVQVAKDNGADEDPTVVAEGTKAAGGTTVVTKANPSWNIVVDPSTSKINGGTKVTVTATLSKNDYPNGKKIRVTADSLPVTADGIVVTAKDVNAAAAQDETASTDATATFVGSTKTADFAINTANDKVVVTAVFTTVSADKDQTLNLTFDYLDATDVRVGDNKAAAGTKAVVIAKTQVGGGSSSSSSDNSSSGGNVIAAGNTSALYNGGNGTVAGFTDLDEAPWASTAITTLAMQNIVNGRGDGTFDPNANITRAEYCQILIAAIGKNATYADSRFNDVPTDAWFYHAVAVASDLGIVSGYGDGNFGPYDLITREQMALMTQKAAQSQNVALTAKDNVSFTDDAAIANWSKVAVYELANAGIINGMGDGTFAPAANATRAQAAVIIYNTFVAK